MALADQLSEQASNLFPMFARFIVLDGKFFIQIFDVVIGISCCVGQLIEGWWKRGKKDIKYEQKPQECS